MWSNRTGAALRAQKPVLLVRLVSYKTLAKAATVLLLLGPCSAPQSRLRRVKLSSVQRPSPRSDGARP